MAYDDVDRSVMGRVNEPKKESQQDLPKNININVGQGQPMSDTTINDSTPDWAKWAALALKGIGAGARGFAKGFAASQGGNPSAMFDEEDVAEEYRKKRKEAEEKEAKANQQAEQNNNVIKPIDNDNQTAWIDYANKYWRMG